MQDGRQVFQKPTDMLGSVARWSGASVPVGGVWGAGTGRYYVNLGILSLMQVCPIGIWGSVGTLRPIGAKDDTLTWIGFCCFGYVSTCSYWA